MKSLHEEQPVILISALPLCETKRWYQVFLGIEEEGIPYQIKEANIPDVVSEAYSAAQRSPLLVGMACTNEEMVVHYKNLQPDNPLFRLAQPLQQDTESLRQLGNNAARLVKGLPFK
jgi:Dehydratase medium subunit.